MINLICPDFVIGRPVYEILLPLVKEYPYIQQEGRRIYSVYGNYPGMIWAGGQVNIKGEVALQEKIVEDLRFYNTYGARLTLTLTNTQLNKIHLLDTYCNNILSELNKTKGNAVLVSTDLMEKHIRENFLNVDIYKSIIGTEEKNYYKSYNRSVLARRCNTNLDKIPIEDRDKLEILCNDPCPDNCPNIYEHYNAYGRMMLRQNFSDKAVSYTHLTLPTT